MGNKKKVDNQECVICTFFNCKYKSLYAEDEFCKLTPIELNALKETSKQKADNFEEYLNELKDNIYVHPTCTPKYHRSETVSSETNGNKRKTRGDAEGPARRKLRSGEAEALDFDYDNQCLICGKSFKKGWNRKFCKVTDSNFKEEICKYLDDSDKDTEFKESVKKRVLADHNLVGLEAKYHATCLESIKPNEPIEEDKDVELKIDNAMQKVFIYIDNNNDCQYTYGDFESDLWKNDDYKPTVDIVKSKLKEHYGEKYVKFSTAINYKSRFNTSRKATLFHILDSPSDYDLVNVKPYFHKTCLKLTNNKKKFYEEENVPASKIDKSIAKIIKFIDDDDDCQYSYNDIKNNILDKNDHLPSVKTISNRLKTRFGEKNVLVRNITKPDKSDNYYFTVFEQDSTDEDEPKKKPQKKNSKNNTKSSNGKDKNNSINNTGLKKSMQKIFNHIDDDDDCQYTFDEFKNKVLEENDYVPTIEEVSNKLMDHYGEDNVIVSKKSEKTYYNILV